MLGSVEGTIALIWRFLCSHNFWQSSRRKINQKAFNFKAERLFLFFRKVEKHVPSRIHQQTKIVEILLCIPFFDSGEKNVTFEGH